MLCALFKSYLLLATFQVAEGRFYCRFLLSLTDLRIETIEDGRGMTHRLMFVQRLIVIQASSVVTRLLLGR